MSDNESSGPSSLTETLSDDSAEEYLPLQSTRQLRTVRRPIMTSIRHLQAYNSLTEVRQTPEGELYSWNEEMYGNSNPDQIPDEINENPGNPLIYPESLETIARNAALQTEDSIEPSVAMSLQEFESEIDDATLDEIFDIVSYIRNENINEILANSDPEVEMVNIY